VFKRTWIVMLAALALGVILSACGGNKLAGELTPIPTLPPGQEPTLVDALQGITPTAAAAQGGQLSQEQLVAMGEQLFNSVCSACHKAQNSVGPAFTGMAQRAATRISGVTAEEYIRQSILDPSAYIVPGFSDVMPKNFAQQYSDTQINALIAYIMAKSGGAATPQAPSVTQEATQQATQEATQAATQAPTQPPTQAATSEATATSTVEATQQPAATGTTSATGDPAAGEKLFAANCSACHGATNGIAPAVTGMGKRAATRIAGMSAEEYIRQSILDPSAYVVPGFSDIMPKDFGQRLSQPDINDLIAYILTQQG
jgi:mono/diheme cytochrome c family protein